MFGVLEVDFIPRAAHGLPGEIGLTRAPGTGAASLVADLERLRRVHAMTTLASLLPDYEYGQLGIAELPARARELGIDLARLSIDDGGVPLLSSTGAFVERILEAPRRGETLVIHCRAGLGRTGLIAGCCLVACGQSPERAIAKVRATRPGTIETSEQARFVHGFATSG